MSTDRDTAGTPQMPNEGGELERLRAEVKRLTGECICDLDAQDRAESAEAALSRVRELAERWEGAETWDGKPAMVDRGFGARLMIALDPASPAPSPDSATAGDMGTRAGSAPSEGHGEEQGHAMRTELRYVCGKCGQQRGGFHKGCDGLWIEQRRTVSEWWS